VEGRKLGSEIEFLSVKGSFGFDYEFGIMMEGGCICIGGVMEDTLDIINFII
jgi:hypothetical protein